MLSRSFCCFRGLSLEAERRLWRLGCRGWDHLSLLGHRLVSPKKLSGILAQLPGLRAAVDGRVADVFLERLPPGHRIRVWPDFADGFGFLDVETTGLGRRDSLTVVGLSIGTELHQFVSGRDLGEFLRHWRRVEVLVTFNGKAFDVPVLSRSFGLSTIPPHIDLRTECRPHGLFGTFKDIEARIGCQRSEAEVGSGAEAAEWWRRHVVDRDSEALDRLLRYNARDTLSLRVLAAELWRRSTEGMPDPPIGPPELRVPGETPAL
jgi:hypothetical protein